jgi:hypothetical protein
LKPNAKSTLKTILLVVFLIAALWPASVWAAPVGQSAASGGLQVDNALIDFSGARPGQVSNYTINVKSGAGAAPMDITVEARGFGEQLSGSYNPLPAADDKSPFTARGYITAISKTDFHLDPGGSVPVEVTITLPQDLKSDTLYAIIYIASKPVEQGNGVANILAVSVPVVITPENVQNTKTAKITDLTVDDLAAGKPITVRATVANTGNRHFNVSGKVTIKSPSGQAVAELQASAPSTAIIPGFSQDLVASYAAMDQTTALEPGQYTANVVVSLDDGTALDQKEAPFQIQKPFRPLADIDDAHLQITCFKDEEPGKIDARSKTDLELSFEGTGKVTGCIAVGKYTQVPADKPDISDMPGDGGLGQKAIKYYAIQSQGILQGVVHIAVHYQENELGDTPANTLFLGMKDGNFWRKLENLDLQTGAQKVTGDILLQSLTDGSIQALGGGNPELPAAPADTSQPTLVIILASVAAIFLIVLLVVIVVRRPRSTPTRR